MKPPAPDHAPEHLVTSLASATRPPLWPHSHLSAEGQWLAHLAQCRVWADLIWSQGFVTGATQAAEWAATPTYIVVTPETMDRIRSATGLPSIAAGTPPAT